MPNLVAVLDANVLYPARLRDLLIRLALAGTYRAQWTEQILDECFRNLIEDRPDLPADHLNRTRTLMNCAVPDASVTGYESLIDDLTLPDPHDRHVLAAAIKAGASTIVTANIRDFPSEMLTAYSVTAMTPDRFAMLILATDRESIETVIEEQAAALKHPPMTIAELLDGLSIV